MVAIRPCGARVALFILAVTAVSGCATTGFFASGASHPTPGQRQKADMALMDAVDHVLQQWWRDVHPCEGMPSGRPPAMLASIPSSIMGRYVWDRLRRNAPAGMSLTETGGTLSSIFGSGSGGMTLRTMQQAGDGWMSLSVERHDDSIDIVLSALAWNEIALCFTSEDAGAGALPVAFQTITVEADRFLRGVSARIDGIGEVPMGILTVSAVQVEGFSPAMWDRVSALGDEAMLPDIQVCVTVDSGGERRCSPVFFDTLSAAVDLPVPPGFSAGFTVTVINVDARGNVAYPYESPYNAVIGSARFDGMPPEVLVGGAATFSNAGLSIGLSYTLPKIPEAKTGAPEGTPVQ